MERLICSAGLTMVEIEVTRMESGESLLQMTFPGPGEKLTPRMAREIADLLNLAADEADPPETVDIGVYATIREKSEYSNQQKKDKHGHPIPFPVTIAAESLDGYLVEGGIGGRYTLYDVDLWNKIDGEYVPLPLHDLPYPVDTRNRAEKRGGR